jgi:hypothetical protein
VEMEVPSISCLVVSVRPFVKRYLPRSVLVVGETGNGAHLLVVVTIVSE